MSTRIQIQIGNHQLQAEIFDTPTGNDILASLPWEAEAVTWGDEIYFQIDAHSSPEKDAVTELAIGDLAFFPPMQAFCIFFGPTPMSRGDEPRAAGLVNVFGKLINPKLPQLKRCRNGDLIKISLAL